MIQASRLLKGDRRLQLKRFRFSSFWASLIVIIAFRNGHASAQETLELVLKNPGAEPMAFRLEPKAQEIAGRPLEKGLTSPLGSLWKLFVFFYLIDRKIQLPAYTCEGKSPEEIFCCKPRASIDRDEALYKSCGLFFALDRLHLKQADWESFWAKDLRLPLAWLTQLANLKPATQVPVAELLQVLETMRQRSGPFRQTEDVLAQTTLIGTAQGLYQQLGSLLRVKTYTWDAPDGLGYKGGFAGWLEGGTVVWSRSRGTSHAVLEKWAPEILRQVNQNSTMEQASCVRVNFFERYPLAKVERLPDLQPAVSGMLRGPYRLTFTSGRTMDIHEAESLNLTRTAGRWSITGRMSINEYVARVLEREVAVRPLEAARAMSVVMRTFLWQNAIPSKDCLTIADSTHLQRVAADKPGTEALRIARWSDRLIWDLVPNIRYHLEDSGWNRLSWKQAVRMAMEGSRFDTILQTAYPGGRLKFQTYQRQPQCRRLADAERWLQGQRRVWMSHLTNMPGFQAPEAIKVCHSQTGAPYSLMSEQTIFVRYSGDRDDQLALTHEYLHLAFQYHPQGSNETFIETLAQTLLSNFQQGLSHATNNLDRADRTSAF